jgi:hydroxymethylpyrimidine pyrophosphatase-like HAD family hydrolase
MVIAVDFDGTIVEHRFPDIGRIRPFAFETLLELQAKKHKLILWTHRSGRHLDEAVDFCLFNGLTFYAINKNYPEEKWYEHDSRKIVADVYIDDRNVGGILSWGEIYQIICPEEDLVTEKIKKTWWKRK